MDPVQVISSDTFSGSHATQGKFLRRNTVRNGTSIIQPVDFHGVARTSTCEEMEGGQDLKWLTFTRLTSDNLVKRLRLCEMLRERKL
ncbi:hypothetical protein COOONC_25776 [Cooperia oncophora]